MPRPTQAEVYRDALAESISPDRSAEGPRRPFQSVLAAPSFRPTNEAGRTAKLVDHLTAKAEGAVPLVPLKTSELKDWLKGRSKAERAWIDANGFEAKAGTVLRMPSGDGGGGAALVGLGTGDDFWAWGGVAAKLAPGAFRIDTMLDARAATSAAIGWALGTYVFDRYRKSDARFATLVWPNAADRDAATRTIEAVFLARDLINTPANDMGPGELADAAQRVARQHKAKFAVTVGDKLLEQNYPTVHAVGRAAARAPRLIDIRWGRMNHPRVTLVGKGVCFDTGGLDLKPAAGMRLMKKDMGGAANVLGLAHMIMAAKLPVRLRVLIPAVENSVSGDAMRPMDVIRTRKGLTVEIGNTDAEGRLILCDALAEADSEKPEVLIDCATLTGAARVALGPELPALFCNDDRLAADLLAAGTAESDPLWRLPLHAPYARMLDSDVADLNNVSEGGFAGAITAALYLERFISSGTAWAHIDMMAWNPSAKPGRPRGGEAQFIRGAFAALAARYGDQGKA